MNRGCVGDFRKKCGRKPKLVVTSLTTSELKEIQPYLEQVAGKVTPPSTDVVRGSSGGSYLNSLYGGSRQRKY